MKEVLTFQLEEEEVARALQAYLCNIGKLDYDVTYDISAKFYSDRTTTVSVTKV